VTFSSDETALEFTRELAILPGGRQEPVSNIDHNSPMHRSDDTGKLVLRLTIGILIILHGIAKLSGGIGSISGMLSSHGVPGVLGYAVYIGEVVAPALLIVGLFTRPAALVIAINMVVAIWLAHSSQLFTLGKTGGWTLELQGLFLFGAIAVAFLGAGRFSIGGIAGKYN
jgi:putative oxidoreductase